MKQIFHVILFLLCCAFPVASREIRGVWLTTNSGLDWPGNVYDEKGQKRLLTDMLDRLRDAHFNMVLFQVQANGDVAWDSLFQPAMSSLTGDGSKKLGYDICRFVIDECHKRDMECHAWIVPFRLGSASNSAKYRGNKVKHPVKSKSELCVRYNGAYYLDPGLPETRKYLLSLYRELVEKYDFDGINLDYTRYPGSAFPDDYSFRKHNPAKMSKNDWRRDNVNRFVSEFYDMVKSVRPNMVVGSAPIGTYKNVGNYGNSTAFDTFQQDPVQWISSGHHELVIPQMYWDEKFGFSDHMTTWVNNVNGKSLVIGLAPYKMLESGWSTDTVISQIEKAMSREGVTGVCFFRARHVLGDEPKVKALYRYLVKHKLAGKKSKRNNKVDSVEKFLE